MAEEIGFASGVIAQATPEEAKPQDPNLPPGVERLPDGQLIRRIQVHIPGTDDDTREQIRPVAATLEEAKAKRMDWYHPELGWVLEGYKLQKDREPQDIMADHSEAMPNPDLFPTKI
jgi:hypothetical protein